MKAKCLISFLFISNVISTFPLYKGKNDKMRNFNGNSIRDIFTDCIPIHAMFMYIVLLYVLA